MRAVLIASLIFLVCAVDLSSKDKPAKVSFQQMAAGMQDAFNCGVDGVADVSKSGVHQLVAAFDRTRYRAIVE